MYRRAGFGDWLSDLWAQQTTAGATGTGATYATVAAGILAGGGSVSSQTIRNIQLALNAMPSSLPQLVVDGVLGPKTRARIAEYQRQVGLSATGNPDNATRNSLAAGIRAGAAPRPASNSPYIDAGGNVFSTNAGAGTTNWSAYWPYLLIGAVIVVVMKNRD